MTFNKVSFTIDMKVTYPNTRRTYITEIANKF